MEKILAQYWAICLLKGGPQDLPASKFLAIATSIVYTVLSVIFNLDRLAFPTAFAAGVVDFALMAGLSYLLLWVRLLSDRWLQTITALVGSGIILTLFALGIEYGLLAMAPESPDPTMPASAGSLLFGLLGLAQIVWSAVIITHILRHALSTNILLAAAFTAVYVYVTYSVLMTLFFVVHE